jgi:glycosidase
VGLYDTLRSVIEGHSSVSHISHFWKSREGIHAHMLRFLENHDEQRVASPQFASDAMAGFPGMVVSGTMHNCPLMLYFGQEIGEPATDEEGFSGFDGRTTIFDYWQVTEYQKWVNKGAFDGAALSDNQKFLQNQYTKLLHARQMFEALRDGSFYDIMYANHNGTVNADKIYAYLRHTPNQTVLVVNNFDKHNGYRFKLVIPKHAFEYLMMSSTKKYTSVDYFEGLVSIAFTAERAWTQGVDMEIKPKSSLLFEL